MKSFASTLAALAVVAGVSVVPAAAEDITAGSLVISQPWSRATAGGAKVGAGYLTVTNKGTTPDRLIDGTLPQAGRVEIHEMKMDDGVMKMRPLANGLEIKPGETVTLAPGGYHIMFMNLNEPFKEGEKLKGELVFEKAGKVPVEFYVGAIAAQKPPAEPHGH